MSLPTDRVLVGVINKKQDLDFLLNQHWYRLPQAQMPNGLYTEYVAFFLSGNAAKKLGESAVYYYAALTGVELVYRKDLLSDKPEKANERYYKAQFRQIQGKNPPVLNPKKRRFAFIYTTWDRFVNARELADLYSKNDYYVDRIYHALRDKSIRIERYWDAQRKETGYGAAVRIICENGVLTGYTDASHDDKNGVYLDSQQPEDKILADIRAQISRMGGALSLSLGTSY
jgi:hypothetical protein